MNRNTLIAVVAFFIVGILIGTQFHGCKGSKPTTGLIRTDTITRFIPRTDTLWKTIQQTSYIPNTIWGHDTTIVHHTSIINGHDTIYTTSYSHSSDSISYADTLRQANEFKAIIFDTLANNRIIGRSVKWAILEPILERDITKSVMIKPALVKVYVGIDALGGKSAGKFNADIAPAASLVIADRYMLDLGYYIFDQQVTAGFKIKLSFKKK